MFWDQVAGVYDIFVNVINRKTHQKLKEIVSDLIGEQDSVLECACGTGFLSAVIAQKCRELNEAGHECTVGFGRQAIDDNQAKLIKIGTPADYLFHAAVSRLVDCQGRLSGRATERFLEIAEQYEPDIIWLHNIHGYYLQYEKLFSWLKSKPRILKYWTLHDCWAFTGHCAAHAPQLMHESLIT